MTKKDYIKPELQDKQMQVECALLAYSVQTNGLGDELSQDVDDLTGNSWGEALGHSRDGSNWGEGEQSVTDANWDFTW